MAKSSELKQSFETKPTDDSTLGNIFSSENINSIVNTAHTQTVAATAVSANPDIPPARVAELTRNASLSKKLTKKGSTINEMYKETSANLPAGVDLNNVLGGVDIVSASDTILRLKGDMNSSNYNKLDEAMMINLVAETPTFTKLLNSDNQYLADLSNSQLKEGLGVSIGTSKVGPFRANSTDTALKYGFGISLAQKLLNGSGDSEGLVDIIENYTGFSTYCDVAFVKKIIDYAALAGNVAIMLAYIADLGSDYKKSDKVRTLRSVLAGYRIGTGVAVSKYADEAVALLSLTEGLHPKWYKYNPTTVEDEDISLLYFQYASSDALTILQYHDATRAAAIIAASWDVRNKPLYYFKGRDFPYLV